MQNATIDLPSTNPVRALTGLARQIALPGEHAPERFPSFPALERTAVMAFTQPFSWNYDLLGQDLHGMLCRQAAYPMWIEYHLSTVVAHTAVWLSDAVFPTASQGGDTFSLRGVPIYNQYLGAASAVPNVAVGVAGATAGLPLQSYVPIGIDGGLGPTPWVYVPNNFVVYIVAAGSSPTAVTLSTMVNFEIWTGPGHSVASFANLTIAIGNTGGMTFFNYGLNNGGYWVRPTSVVTEGAAGGHPAQFQVYFVVANAASATTTYTPSAANPGTVNLVGVVAGVPMVPAFSPVEFANSTLPWRDTRVTAVGALLSNVTQVLNKSGTILGGRISPTIVSPWKVTSTTITTLHPAEKAFLPMETGLYTYCPPSTDMSSFWDYTALVQFTGGFVPVYRLDNTSLVNHFFYNAPVNETTAVSCSYHFEFRTSSSLFQVALSGLTLEALHSAQLALATAGFFFENPEHDSVLGKVIGAVKTIAPHLLGVAEMIPQTASVARGVKMMMRGAKKIPVKSNPQTVPATSAAKSGITRPPGKKSKQSQNQQQKQKKGKKK